LSRDPKVGIARMQVSIPPSSALKGGNIDGCGRGVRTSIGTLASTKAHPSTQGKRERFVRSRATVSLDNIPFPVILALYGNPRPGSSECCYVITNNEMSLRHSSCDKQ